MNSLMLAACLMYVYKDTGARESNSVILCPALNVTKWSLLNCSLPKYNFLLEQHALWCCKATA